MPPRTEHRRHPLEVGLPAAMAVVIALASAEHGYLLAGLASIVLAVVVVRPLMEWRGRR
jgi:hypothetical protein